jgi:hypothetical protein
MQNLKDRKSLLIKILAVILLAVLCCNLPGEILFWKFCTEQDRDIPPNTEVIVSACKDPVATGVPGGDVVFVREGRSGRMYLLDLRTGEKRKIPNDSLFVDKGIFLSSELVWLEGSSGRPGSPSYKPHYILDLTTGKRYELVNLDWLPLKDGKFDHKYYVYFQSAEQVFIFHSRNVLIALPSDFRQHPEENVIFSQYSLESGASADKGKLLEQLMKELGINYEIIDFLLQYANVPSPTGRYVVRNDGIYLSGTNTPIVTREYAGGYFMGGYFKSWYYDESGVVVQENSKYLFSSTLGPQYFLIPRPILKLRLPESP